MKPRAMKLGAMKAAVAIDLLQKRNAYAGC